MSLSGRPRKAPKAPASRVRPDSQLDDMIQPVPKKTRAHNAPRQQEKNSFIGMLLADPRLDAADKKAIRHAGEAGLTASDVSALIVYEMKLVQKFHAEGSLASKDMVVALGKIAQQAGVACQLAAAATAQDLPTRMEVTFTRDTSGTSVIGDLMDAE